jgi:hypothetical protein
MRHTPVHHALYSFSDSMQACKPASIQETRLLLASPPEGRRVTWQRPHILVAPLNQRIHALRLLAGSIQHGPVLAAVVL